MHLTTRRCPDAVLTRISRRPVASSIDIRLLGKRRCQRIETCIGLHQRWGSMVLRVGRHHITQDKAVDGGGGWLHRRCSARRN
jgi:hypothetical protein